MTVAVVTLSAIILVWLLLPRPAYANNPSPTLIIIKGDYADLQTVRTHVEQVGGYVGHVFPPNALIARLTPAQAEQIRALPPVVAVTFDPISPLSPLNAALPSSSVTTVWNDAFHSLSLDVQATQPFSDEVLIAPDLPPEGDASAGELGPAAIPYGGSFYDTSRYMVGDVVVAMVLPESNGLAEPSIQDWTPAEVAAVQSTTVSGMDKWAQAEPNANLTFIYVWADAPPTGGISYTVESDYEAEQHSNFNSNVINSFMARLGYTSSSSFTNIRNYINDLRDAYDSDWAYLVQARDDSSGCGRASAYLYGPATTIYDCDLRSGFVVAHESGHIFGAMDEYCPDACRSPISRYGYLQVVNANSQGPGGSGGPGYFNGKGEALSNIMRNTTFAIGPYTRGQVGWQDSDGDGVLDVYDTFPNTVLATPAVGASVVISGQVNVMPLPGSGNDISLNRISGVDVQINGLTWLPAAATDGAFDEAVESFYLELPLLPNGLYTIEAQGKNHTGNIERSPAQTTLTVSGSPATNAAPFAAFEISPDAGSTATIFTVNAGASTDVEAHSLQARWDWENDGLWDTAWSAGLSATHSYATPGTKVVALELKDSLGAVAKTTRVVEVNNSNTPPTPFFVVEQGDAVFGDITPTFNFDAAGSRDAETPASGLEYRWDFDGNGSWDTGWSTANQQTNHTFTLDAQGKSDGLPRSNHWATALQVRDGNGATAETTRHIWANPYNHAPATSGIFSDTLAHTAAPLPFDFSLTSDADFAETWDGLLEYRFDWNSDGNWDTDYRSGSSWASYLHPEIGSFNVTMQSRDRFGATDVISQSLTIIEPPILRYNGQMEATAFVNHSVTRTLIISNNGQFDLSFNLEEIDLREALTYTVSDSLSGPLTYNWIPSWPGSYYPTLGNWTATTATREADDEGYVGPIDLGFAFPFYGRVYTQVYLAANGYLSFNPPPADFGSGSIPDGTEPNATISAFWADLNMGIIATDWPTDGVGSLAYNPVTADGNFVAEYWGATLAGSGDWSGNSFEIVLQPNGNILLQYQFLPNAPSAPTGIENHSGSQGLTYSSPLTNNLAVAFTPNQTDIPWFTLSQTSGAISGSGSNPIAATFDASGLAPGIYSGRLLLYSSDPAKPFVGLPVSFTVISSDLSVFKAVNTITPDEGETITYTISVINNGPDAVSNIIISDTLPVSMTFVVAGSTQGSYDNSTGLWDVGTLGGSQQATLTIQATLEAGTAGLTLINTAVISRPEQLYAAGVSSASAVIKVNGGSSEIYLPVILKKK